MTESWPLWAALGVVFAVVLVAYMAANDDDPPSLPESSFDI